MQLSEKTTKELIRSLHLSQDFLNKVKEPDSPASQFMSAFFLNFILKNLDEKERQEFILILLKEKDTKDSQKLIEFLKTAIPGFEKECAIECSLALKKVFNYGTKS